MFVNLSIYESMTNSRAVVGSVKDIDIFLIGQREQMCFKMIGGLSVLCTSPKSKSTYLVSIRIDGDLKNGL